MRITCVSWFTKVNGREDHITQRFMRQYRAVSGKEDTVFTPRTFQAVFLGLAYAEQVLLALHGGLSEEKIMRGIANRTLSPTLSMIAESHIAQALETVKADYDSRHVLQAAALTVCELFEGHALAAA